MGFVYTDIAVSADGFDAEEDPAPSSGAVTGEGETEREDS